MARYGNGPNRMSINKTILFLIKNTNISEMYFANRGKYWSALRNYENLPIWSHTQGYNLHMYNVRHRDNDIYAGRRLFI